MNRRISRLIIMVLISVMVFSTGAIASEDHSFSDTNDSEIFKDVKAGDWYYNDVVFVFSNGIMNGVSASSFMPNATTTRGMVMTMLARLQGIDTSVSEPWYQTGMEWAKKEAISDGSEPQANVTREQIVTMLFRYNTHQYTTGVNSTNFDAVAFRSGYLKFADTDEVSAWAEQAMKWAVINNIIVGTGDKLEPKGNATRAQVAAIFARYIRFLKSDSNDYELDDSLAEAAAIILQSGTTGDEVVITKETDITRLWSYLSRYTYTTLEPWNSTGWMYNIKWLDSDGTILCSMTILSSKVVAFEGLLYRLSYGEQLELSIFNSLFLPPPQ